ncbi:glycosyltransferase family 2 protein [Acidimicrobiia bacterium]|nr:glycosyltransferase family 2 protein [Acidimicrobiia bacterium]MDC0595334.1 glycosyltransferase family 2 protein [Acidimicrobiia bacterium]
MNNLAVIVPFYNEENYLQKSLNRLIDYDIFDQIILVDDCSTDNSAIIANENVLKTDKIIYLKSSTNKGKGSALNLAKNIVETSHVIIHDADLEYFPEDIIEMFDCVQENQDSLILGSRFIGNKKRTNIYSRTMIANKVMSSFFSLLNNYPVSDIATCYKLMPTSFFKEMDIKENGFSIEIEILAKFLKYNKSIIEIPIRYEGRSYEEGKKIKTSDGFKYLLNTVKYRFFN